MTKLFFLAAAALLAGPNGRAQNALAAARVQERSVATFDAIDVTDGIQVYVRDGQIARLQVDASTQGLRDKIKTVVAGNVLKVYFDASGDPAWHGLVGSREEFKVYVSTHELQALTAAKGAAVTLESFPAGAGTLAVRLLSGARLAGSVRVNTLDIKLRGGATASVTGTAAVVNVRATEGSGFRSPGFKAGQCTAFAASASAVRLAVAGSLDAESVNEAVIEYSGPAALTREHREQNGRILHI
ncbi:GIN domain-containing protein [Hymenobacter caeli]|uniref:Putative auto-transporter adhesin head GIN domain-containing protein n=1 Tax=Hymenobacter caeli TaxID=2735894 RepID=A0ABX2FUI6_9BACT|nr:DUF2807 domain-containing protein [Hymenobacter caeli]NRT20836.1 hypothetical protein [Hymenobacter caeli]